MDEAGWGRPELQWEQKAEPDPSIAGGISAGRAKRELNDAKRRRMLEQINRALEYEVVQHRAARIAMPSRRTESEVHRHTFKNNVKDRFGGPLRERYKGRYVFGVPLNRAGMR
jgi:hypothetical protein